MNAQTEPHLINQRRAVRAYQMRHHAAGLCVSCARPATRNWRCELHADLANAAARRRWARKRLAGAGVTA